MSQWTHVLGIIHFDSMNLITCPVPKNQKEITEEERMLVGVPFSTDIPEGSEGPLEVTVETMERGVTVFITGNLRDFGKKDLPKVVEWVNDCLDYIADEGVEGLNYAPLLKDVLISCEVENDETKYIIEITDWENLSVGLKEYRGLE